MIEIENFITKTTATKVKEKQKFLFATKLNESQFYYYKTNKRKMAKARWIRLRIFERKEFCLIHRIQLMRMHHHSDDRIEKCLEIEITQSIIKLCETVVSCKCARDARKGVQCTVYIFCIAYRCLNGFPMASILCSLSSTNVTQHVCLQNIASRQWLRNQQMKWNNIPTNTLRNLSWAQCYLWSWYRNIEWTKFCRLIKKKL